MAQIRLKFPLRHYNPTQPKFCGYVLWDYRYTNDKATPLTPLNASTIDEKQPGLRQQENNKSHNFEPDSLDCSYARGDVYRGPITVVSLVDFLGMLFYSR